MKVKIRRIGNGVGFLIPKNILTLMHLKEGDEIDRSKQVFHSVSTTLVALLDSASVLKKWSGKLLQNTVAVEIKAASLRGSIHGARKRMKKGKSRRQISRVLEGLDLKRVEDETNAILRADALSSRATRVVDTL